MNFLASKLSTIWQMLEKISKTNKKFSCPRSYDHDTPRLQPEQHSNRVGVTLHLLNSFNTCTISIELASASYCRFSSENTFHIT